MTGPGWLLVCSDGLWNYASDPSALRAQVDAAGTTDPPALAQALVEWAIGQGGHDNITVALARLGTPSPRDGLPVGENASEDEERQPHG